MPAIVPFGSRPGRFFSRGLLSFLLLLFIEINAFSQNSAHTSFANLRMNDVNIHAVRHFLNNFSLATGVIWSKEENYFVASFTSDHTRDKAYYKDNGNFAFCVKYYLADALNGSVKSTILEKFPGCKIMLVTELTDLDSQTFIVNIKTGVYIKTLRCDEDGIEVTESIVDAGI